MHVVSQEFYGLTFVERPHECSHWRETSQMSSLRSRLCQQANHAGTPQVGSSWNQEEVKYDCASCCDAIHHL